MSTPSSPVSSPCPVCPRCQNVFRQIKGGRTASGSQRFRCMDCQYTYNPAPKKKGYPNELRLQAVKMYVDGLNFRRIGRLLGVHHQTVVNWVNASHAALPTASEVPSTAQTVDIIEMDELFTFVGTKKQLLTS